MTIGDRVRGFFGISSPAAVRSPKAPATGLAVGSGGGSRWGVLEPRRGARTLRRFSEQNVWVRTAINRRKRELATAKFAIVRIDDPKAKPDAGVVRAATELFTFVNDTRVSLSWLLNMLVEDILVGDCGAIEKEKTAGGKLVALWPLDGMEIAPDPKWDGSDPKKPRYSLIRDGRTVATYRNDELVYMMQNPRTCSAVGYSPLEVLFETVEADLYAERFEHTLMRETAPAGMIYLGAGVPPDKVQAYRDMWEQEIAGTRDIVFLGGSPDPTGQNAGSPPVYTPFTRSARDEMRREYAKWLATKVAAAFEMDLLAFNLSEAIHKSIGGNLQAKTDAGLIGLAEVIAAFITREVLWELDPKHVHGFQFIDLTPRDAKHEADVDQALMKMGATTPNEVRIKRGMDAYPESVGDPDHWANLPYPFNNNITAPPEEDPIEDNPENAVEGDDDSEEEPKKPDDDEETS